jgi:hypothetical protein
MWQLPHRGITNSQLYLDAAFDELVSGKPCFVQLTGKHPQFHRKVLAVKDTILALVNSEGATAWLYRWTAEIVLAILIGIRLLLWRVAHLSPLLA